MKDTVEEVEVVEQLPAVQASAPVNIEDFAMDVAALGKRSTIVHDAMQSVFRKDHHYGVIPGTNGKPSLLKPGAEILAMTFRMATAFDIVMRELERGHRDYEVTCTLTHQPTEQYLGQGVGSCSTMENKYRFRNASHKCPHCDAEAIIRGKEEYGGGWLCFRRKGGCGATWPRGMANPFEGTKAGKVEYDNPADYYNTALKMSKKRAFVDAVITVAAASDIFTQDPDEMHTFEGNAKPRATQSASEAFAGKGWEHKMDAVEQKLGATAYKKFLAVEGYETRIDIPEAFRYAVLNKLLDAAK